MLDRISDENMIYVINILQNIEALSSNKAMGLEKSQAAFQNIIRMEKRLPSDFDADAELQKSREERYGFAH